MNKQLISSEEKKRREHLLQVKYQQTIIQNGKDYIYTKILEQ